MEGAGRGQEETKVRVRGLEKERERGSNDSHHIWYKIYSFIVLFLYLALGEIFFMAKELVCQVTKYL